MKSFKDHQLYQLTKTHLLETIREPEVLFWGMVFPILISIGLGLAFTQSAESKFKVVMVGESLTELDSLLAVYARQEDNKHVWRIEDKTLGNTIFTFERSDWRSAIISLKRGEADLIVSDSSRHVRYHFDPLNSQAQLAYNKLSALIKSPVCGRQILASQYLALDAQGRALYRLSCAGFDCFRHHVGYFVGYKLYDYRAAFAEAPAPYGCYADA